MKKRLLALLLCAVMCLGLLSGCGETGLTVDGHHVDLDHFGYYYGSLYKTYSAMGKANLAFDSAITNIKYYYATQDLAKEYGIEIEPLERKAVLDEIKQQKVQLGSTNWKKFLTLLGLKESQYVDIAVNAALQAKVQNHLFNRQTGIMALTDEQVADLYCEDFICARHILISTQTATTQAEFDEALAEAEQVLAELKNGGDFEALMEAHNDDPGATTAGYYFVEGQMVAAFEEAALALAENEISDIVQSSFGYHIIQRLPMDREYVMTQVDTYYTSYSNFAYSDMMTEICDQMEVVTTEEFENYNFYGHVQAMSQYGGGSSSK